MEKNTINYLYIISSPQSNLTKFYSLDVLIMLQKVLRQMRSQGRELPSLFTDYRCLIGIPHSKEKSSRPERRVSIPRVVNSDAFYSRFIF